MTAEQPGGRPATPPAEEPRKRSYIRKLWVPVVILIGLIIGEAISYSSMGPGRFPPQGRFGFPPYFQESPALQVHVILTTVEVTLLLALLVIYIRMYAETRAAFSLGLIVMLLALLVQSLLSYPLIIGYYGPISLEQSNLWADLLTVCAYAVFLYLSLE